MKRLRIMRRKNDKKIIWNKLRRYIDFWILTCCLIIAFNIHPTSNTIDSNTDNKKMIYIFHDYEWNEYILNDSVHGAADSFEYLFDKDVPDTVKWNDNPNYKDSVSLGWNKKDNLWNDSINQWDVKDNQVAIENIMSDLWMNWDSEDNDDYLVISLWNNEQESDNQNNEETYSIKEDLDDSTLIIEKDPKITNENNINDANNMDTDVLVAKTFTYISDWRVIPTLVSWNELSLDGINSNILAYNDNTSYGDNEYNIWNETNSGVSIIKDYKDCMTPRWYKIVHWDSVLAYKQLDSAPDICNIERRYCRNWKLSWTYTQQWCSINKNYSYDLWWQAEVPHEEEEIKWWARQNPDWSVTVRSDEIWWDIVFERPNRSTTEYSYNESNTRVEPEWIEQTTRPTRDCTTPRWEKVKHGWFIQAFKHENWFSDAPCEAQIRLCSMWELMGSFTESTCKTRDTSFIDWINWSPTRETYSEEKLDWVRKRIKDEEIYYRNARKNEKRSTDSDALDKILYILDQD